MADDASTPTEPDRSRGTSGAADGASLWVRRIVIAVVVLIVAYVAWRVSAAFFPRWWAQRIGNQVDGRFVAGTTWGLFYGIVFTLVPLLVLAQVRRHFLSWTWRGIVAVVAVLLAAPNWLTLSVVLGDNSAARAGRRIMDVDAPNFRAATLFGVIIAVVLAGAITYVEITMKRRRSQVKQLKGERDDLRSRQSSQDT